MSEPIRQLKKAQAELKAGKLDKAVMLSEKLLGDKDLVLPTRILLANALTQQGDLETAARYTCEAADHAPDNGELQIAASDILERLKRYEEAFPYIQRALSKAPGNSVLWRKMLANMLVSARKSAAEHRAQTDEKASSNSITLSFGANEAIPQQLLSLASKALQTFPDDAELVTLIGEIFLEANQFKAATLCFERCLSVRPPLYVAHHNWLKLKFEGALYEDIIAYYKEHKKAVGNNALCVRVAAGAYENIGEDQEAMTLLDRALQLRPGDVTFIGARGRVYNHLGEFEKAIEDFSYAIVHEPHEPTHGNNRRIAYLGLGRIAEAAQDEPFRFELCGSTPYYQFDKPLWQEEDLSGKRLLVWSDEGVGDVFKYGNITRELPADCHVILMAQPKTVSFLKAVLPDVEVRPLPKRFKRKRDQNQIDLSARGDALMIKSIKHDDTYTTFAPIEEDFDYQRPLGRLYGIYRPSLNAFKGKQRAFSIPEEYVKPFASLDILNSPDDVTHVGLAWDSMTDAPGDWRMHFKIEDLLPILRMPGFKFYNFQYTVSEEEITAFRETHNVPLYHAPGLDLFDDLLGNAAFASCMDLFIGPSSTSSDIAGSVGVKSYRHHLVHSVVNLGQDYVPWYPDQKSVTIPWGKSVQDFIPDMMEWLEANKQHRSKNRPR